MPVFPGVGLDAFRHHLAIFIEGIDGRLTESPRCIVGVGVIVATIGTILPVDANLAADAPIGIVLEGRFCSVDEGSGNFRQAAVGRERIEIVVGAGCGEQENE